MIRVLLAEDQAMVRGALAALLSLEGDIQIVADVARGDEVVPAALDACPDVALLDIEMPGGDGLTAAAQLHAQFPSCRVLILTTFGRPGYLRRAMESGVVGFLLKDAPAEQMAAAIRRAMAGERIVDPALAAAALSDGNSPLTDRERAVLAAATRGASIAESLSLSEGTVRNYLSVAIQKLGAHNRVEAASLRKKAGCEAHQGLPMPQARLVRRGCVGVRPGEVAAPKQGHIPGSKGDDMAFSLMSSAFDPQQPIPARYSRDGENISPDLAWNDTPAGTATLALIVDDPDAPRGVFTHWVIYNIPGIPGPISSLPAGVPHGDRPPNAGIQGRNDFGDIGYGGPQPPPGKPHHYRFTVYALHTTLPLRPGATKQQVLDAMRGHVLGQAQLIGTYQNRAVGASR